jgi:hypothetical protein
MAGPRSGGILLRALSYVQDVQSELDPTIQISGLTKLKLTNCARGKLRRAFLFGIRDRSISIGQVWPSRRGSSGSAGVAYLCRPHDGRLLFPACIFRSAALRRHASLRLILPGSGPGRMRSSAAPCRYSGAGAMLTTSGLGPSLGAGLAQRMLPRRLSVAVPGLDNVMVMRS